MLKTISISAIVLMSLVMIIPVFAARWNPKCDINGDGKVDGRDMTLVVRAFGSHGPNYDYPGEPASPNWNPKCDINGDGKVDGRDVTLVALAFGSVPGDP